MSRTINDAIIGAIVGNILGIDSIRLQDALPADEVKRDVEHYIQHSQVLSVMSDIIRSIKKNDGFQIDDIRNKIESNDAMVNYIKAHGPCGVILCWVYLAAFNDIFIDHETFDSTVKQICQISYDDDVAINVCIEYCHLLHDIFCHHIDIDGIVKILPELDDILAGDVPIKRGIRAVFRAGLWAFVHSTDYESAIENCRHLEYSDEFTNWISTVAGTLAGLYYGADSIPKEMIYDYKIDEYLEGRTF